jgi:hypothetical protein
VNEIIRANLILLDRRGGANMLADDGDGCSL